MTEDEKIERAIQGDDDGYTLRVKFYANLAPPPVTVQLRVDMTEEEWMAVQAEQVAQEASEPPDPARLVLTEGEWLFRDRTKPEDE